MKTRLFSLLLAILFTALPPATAQDAAPARLNLLSVKVDVETVSREREAKSKNVSQTKKLKITLENRNKEEVVGKVDWKLVGKNLATRDLVAMGADVINVKLAPGETKTVESNSATFAEKKAPKSNGKNKNAKKGTDTGEDYKGYFVEVFDANDKLIGSAYSPGMKEDAKGLTAPVGKH